MAVLTKPKGQSAHWYHRDGTPQHEMPLKDGSGMRPTHLGDARKLGLYPSVSGIIGMLHKAGLEKWKINQAILATLRTSRKDGQSEKHYLDVVRDAAFQQVDDAADFGTAIHAEIEKFLRHDHTVPYVASPLAADFVRPTINWMVEKGIKIENPEKVLVNAHHGFAGTCDAPYRAAKSFGVLDYKTNKTKPGEKIAEWPEKLLQIAAYNATYWGEAALDNPMNWGGNIYISSTERGRTVAIMYNHEMLKRGWEVFKALCAIWRHFNEFDPRLPAGAVQDFPQSVTIEIAPPMPVPTTGGTTATPAVATVPPQTTAPLPESPSVPSSPTNPSSPSQGSVDTDPTVGILQVPNPQNEVDGIKFLSPLLCKEWKKESIPTIYSWWYHPADNKAKIGFSADGGLMVHGWVRCFKAYAADIDMENRAAGKSDPVVGTNGIPIKPGSGMPPGPSISKDDLKKSVARPAPKEPAAPGSKERLVELENMKMGFGKHKTKRLGDVPNDYFVWMLEQMLKPSFVIPAHLREYLTRDDVVRAIDTIAGVK